MRTFKTISRLDFPLSFAIVDNLGMFAEVLHEASDKSPMRRTATNLNLIQHVVKNSSMVGEDTVELNLALGSLDFVVEYKTGASLGQTYKHPAVALANVLVRKLQDAKVQKIERIGLRNWILIQDPKFTFAALRESFGKRLALIRDAVTASFPTLEDVGAVIEASSTHGENVRVNTGPYRVEEQGRYFSISHEDIKEGLVVDIDIWQSKLEMPALSLPLIIQAQEKLAQRVVQELVGSLEKEFA